MLLNDLRDRIANFDAGTRHPVGDLKNWLKKFPPIVKIKRRIWAGFDPANGTTTLNVLSTFPLYAPNSAGRYKDRAALTLQTINQVFPFLCALSERLNGRLTEVEDIAGIPKTEQEKQAVSTLKERLDFYGSDKANNHNYHHLYGSILSDRHKVQNVFEIGLGTNNVDVVSNMGAAGRPGASLRAFRDFCPNANIFGADVDKRILFNEERIDTHFVDQTDPSTFERLVSRLPSGSFDLVVDDGLHSPNANVAALCFGLEIVRKDGWVVIEDINRDALDFWQVVAALLPSRYRAKLYSAEGAIVFAVQRLD